MKTTSFACVVIAAAALLGCQVPASRPAAIDGTWMAVSAERNGKPTDELNGNRLTFAGSTFVIERGGATLYRGTFTIDPARSPAHIDFHHTEGVLKAATWRGVYAMQGDTLTVADNAPDMGKARPAAFAAPANSGHVVVVFRRAAR
jgi:uncharacterized protein (TIGR03067 family)